MPIFNGSNGSNRMLFFVCLFVCLFVCFVVVVLFVCFLLFLFVSWGWGYEWLGAPARFYGTRGKYSGRQFLQTAS